MCDRAGQQGRACDFMIRKRLAALAIGVGAIVPPAAAQQLGPPIPPEQVLRQQAAPIVPPVQVPPSVGETVTAPQALPNVQQDRVARCQHQAAVERVPRSQRGAYVHHCAFGN